MSAGQVRCLVTGATGYIGARLVPRLLDEGHRVRALARNPDKLADVPWRERAEVARGDLGDVDSLIAAFDGMDVVYYLVHSMGTSKNFAAEENRAVRNVVTAARRTGVRRVVYLSGLHPEQQQALAASRITQSRGRRPHRLRHRDRGAAGRSGRRVGLGVVRNDPPPHRPVAGDDHTEVGAQQNSADRGARRAVLPGRGGDGSGAVIANVGYRRARRAGVRRHDAGLCRGRAAAQALFDRAAVFDADDRQPVGWDRDPDSARSGAAADRITGMRRGDAQLRHRHDHRAATGRPDRLPRAVALALNRAARGLPDATWASLQSEPADRCPATRTGPARSSTPTCGPRSTAAQPDDVWKSGRERCR